MYTALGFSFQHSSQTAPLERTYNLDVAACFLKCIEEILGCGVRVNGVSTTTDEEGGKLMKSFLAAIEAQNVSLQAPLDGVPLADVVSDEESVESAVEAKKNLHACESFLNTVLGENYQQFISAAVYYP